MELGVAVAALEDLGCVVSVGTAAIGPRAISDSDLVLTCGPRSVQDSYRSRNASAGRLWKSSSRVRSVA
jgi:hypothetical protein